MYSRRVTFGVRGLLAVLASFVLAGCEMNTFTPTGTEEPFAEGKKVIRSSNALTGVIGKDAAALYMVTSDQNNCPGTFPLLVSNGRGFQLTCAGDVAGQLRLVDGAGFVSSGLSLYPQSSFSDPDLQQALGISNRNIGCGDLLTLPCKFSSANGRLLRINVDGVDEFFLDLLEPDLSPPDALGRAHILRTVGCGELLASMGLDPRKALRVDYAVANSYWLLDDKYGINCVKGTPPSQLVPTLVASTGGLNQIHDRGATIAALDFRVDHLAPGDVATLVVKSDECGPFAVSGLKVTGVIGKPPHKFCETKFQAHVVSGKDASGAEIAYDTNELTLHIDLPCEIDSSSNCGGCGVACAGGTNQTATCQPNTGSPSGFACQAQCATGWDDCDSDSDPANGCEASLSTTTNCGRCGNACTSPNASTLAACVAGTCGTTCRANFADCDGNPANGCEADLLWRGTCGSCTNVCDPYGICVNTQAGLACQCPPLFEGDGYRCGPIDACATNNGGCSPDATCERMRMGTRACHCNPGFTGDGFTCTDVDECADGNNGGCSYFASCTNTPGSYTCTCPAGWEGDGVTCVMPNPCATNNGGCSQDAQCYSKYGTAMCFCNPMYDGDGRMCIRKPLVSEGPYSWTTGQASPVSLGSSYSRMCWFSRIAGLFGAPGDVVSLTSNGYDHFLNGASAGIRLIHNGQAKCAETDAYLMTEAQWFQGQGPVDLGPANDRVCFLTGVGGRFVGGGEYVQTTIRNGEWFLEGGSQQTGVNARAMCYGLLHYSGEGNVLSTGGLKYGVVGFPGQVCALTSFSGNFLGYSNSVEITTDGNGYSYLNVTSAAGGWVNASARCFW